MSFRETFLCPKNRKRGLHTSFGCVSRPERRHVLHENGIGLGFDHFLLCWRQFLRNGRVQEEVSLLVFERHNIQCRPSDFGE